MQKNVCNIEDETGLKGIERTIEYFKEINMPTNFTEFKIGIQSEEIINELTDRATKNGTLEFKRFRKLNREDVFNIFKMSNV